MRVYASLLAVVFHCLLLSSGIAFAQTTEPLKRASTPAACAISDPDIATYYEGPCVNGKAHGHGRASGRDTYLGEFVAGLASGKGAYQWSSGNKYVGDFKDGKRTGKGVFHWANGDKYVGEYKDGERDGKGVYQYGKGDKYVGEYKNGKVNGQGVWERGSDSCPPLKARQHCNDRMEGEWVDDRLVEGKITFSDGDTYVGRLTYLSDGTLQMQHKTARGKGDNDFFEDAFLGLKAVGKMYLKATDEALAGKSTRKAAGSILFTCTTKCSGFIDWSPGSASLQVLADNASDASRRAENDLRSQCKKYPFHPSGNNRGEAGLSAIFCTR
jgi:hypothetical protein